MTRARPRLADTLSNHNFRLYASAQFLHAAGMWAHRIAELWLVYEITDSALAVGIATSARAGASIVLAPVAGTLADRVDRRLLLSSTQFAKALTAGGLAAAAVAMGEDIPLGLLYGAIMVLGVVGAIDTPLRRAFVRDVVQGRVAAMYGVVFVGARAVGGPLLGWLVDAFGSSTALVAVGLGTTACAAVAAVALASRPLSRSDRA